MQLNPARRPAISLVVFCLVLSGCLLTGLGRGDETASGPAFAAGGDAEEAQSRLSDPEFQARAKAYTRGNYILYLLDTIWTALVAGWLAFSGLSSRAWRRLKSAAGEGSRASVLYVAGLVTLLSLAALPLDYYDGFVREHAYGFSTQSAGGWVVDRVKGLGVSVIVFSIFVLPLYGAIRRFPRSWWILGAGLGCVFATILVAIAPVALDPIFNEFTPLPDAELKTRILDLAHRNGIMADDVFQMDASTRSVHDNAYVTGLLGTQRIVLYDTLLSSYEPDEIAFVMGHEMGHYVLDHIWHGLALSFLLIFFVFWVVYRAFNRILARFPDRTGFKAAWDLSTLPLMLLIVTLVLFATLPIQSAFSRRMESEADLFALQTADNPAAGPRAFRKMAARNLSDPRPAAIIEWFLYSHPAIGRRIERAEAYVEEAVRR